MSYRVIWRERILDNIHTLTFITLQRGGDPNAIAGGSPRSNAG